MLLPLTVVPSFSLVRLLMIMIHRVEDSYFSVSELVRWSKVMLLVLVCKIICLVDSFWFSFEHGRYLSACRC